ncbi:MAG TPA: Ig-like domain repeat protein, partial [Gemmataceae bacterium]
MIAAACRSWLKHLFRILSRKPTCRRSRTWTLCLEPLEDRTLLSTFFVVNVGDTGSGCANSGDLRSCITQVNATPGPNVIAFALPGTGGQFATSVQTDKLDYSPGQTAIITGSGFQAGESVDLQVVNTATGTPAGNPPTWTVVADTNGNIQTSWTCTSDLLGDTLQLSATGESSGRTASETFKDSNPTTTTVTASPNPSNDGQSVTFTATVTNTQSNSSPPGSVDFYEVIDDSSHLLGSGTLSGNGNSATATFATSTLSVGSHTIYAVYMPSANGFDSSTSSAVTQNVNNAAPSITSLSPNSAVEGSGAFTLTVNGSGFNQNSTVQWNNSALATSYDSSTGQLNASVPASDVAEEGTVSVNVVNGGDGSSTSNTVTFTITDAAPTVNADQSSVTAPENQAASTTGTWSDYDDSVTLSADHGTVTQNANGTWSWSGTGDENNPYTVTITATNADGSKSTTSFGVSFTDVAPTVSADKSAVTAPENQAATNTGTWSDNDDPVSLSASYGTVVQNANGTWSWSGTGDKSNNGTVTITATNADGST